MLLAALFAAAALSSAALSAPPRRPTPRQLARPRLRTFPPRSSSHMRQLGLEANLTSGRCRSFAKARANEEEEEEEENAAAGPPANQLAAWAQANLLQGVAPSSETFAIIAVYFVQGALGLAALARTYFLKDNLHLSPAEVSALQGLFILPWTVKPLYGFFSDGLPLFGYRRKSYLAAAGAVGTLAWLSLATVVSNAPQALVASLLGSLSVAVSDVVVDSLVVERAREDPTASSGALQSLCWSSQALGGLATAYLSGYLLQLLTPQQVFLLTSLFPLLVVLMSLQLDERRVDPSERSAFRELLLSQGQLLWQTIRQRQVWLPTLFIFLWQATPSSETAFFYFLTGDPTTTAGIGISAEQLGRVKAGSSVAALVGIWAYRRFLKDVPIKDTLFWCAIASVPLGMTQLLLITHANRALGLSDYWFTFGDSLVLTVLGEFAFMPLLVLAAALCPPGIEGTLFATLMSVFNGAGVVGTELGAALTAVFGITETNFDNLAYLVILCNLSSLAPLLGIHWLADIPKLQPGRDMSTDRARSERPPLSSGSDDDEPQAVKASRYEPSVTLSPGTTKDDRSA